MREEKFENVLPENKSLKSVIRSGFEKYYSPWITMGWTVFLLSFFLAPNNSVQKDILYNLIVGPLFISLFFVSYRSIFREKLLLGYFLLLFYLALTCLWSPAYSTDFFVEKFRQSGYIAIFLVASIYVVKRYPRIFDYCFPLLFIASCIAGVLMAVTFYAGVDWNFELPMRPEWKFRNQIRLANTYGIIALLALMLLMVSKKSWVVVSAAPAFLVAIVVLLLARSQGGVYALLLTLPCLVLVKKDIWQWLSNHVWKIILFLTVTSIIVYQLGVIDNFLHDGWSLRDMIWPAVLAEWKSHFLFGTGMLVDPSIIGVDGSSYAHEHNLSLAVLRQSGLVGFILFHGLFTILLYRCATGAFVYQRMFAIILIFSFLASLPSGKFPILRTEDTWFWVWLPIALAFASLSFKPPAGFSHQEIVSEWPK